ncbi:amino-7-oxononanoate synthase [Candidatus Omnitrophus magneticus]|uniref:8-amino-7-oxononanoate synthase n=1 Tax=Candidatus Omnitrophus magneticus TaxID=1609969 RepID=A0A0F0CTH6_9BACT|nr:amino-7-oxononanoate synthase [Candidatus Omnitrophus magneticus]
MENKLKKFLLERESNMLFRELTTISSLKQGKILVNDNEFINFSSNDYLGLTSHSEILNSLKSSDLSIYSSASSRLMTGSSPIHEQLEKMTARFKGKEESLVFTSGYQANVGIISALCGKDDVIFLDKLSHASIVDGVILSGAKYFRFRHNDMDHLEELLSKERPKHGASLIVTETVFSMDGDIAPLKQITVLKNKYDSMLMVDEAHATGIFGKNGAGITEELGLEKSCDIIMGTFSKALGGFGAYIACSSLIKNYLVNTCRSFIYTTSLPLSIIKTDITALEIIKNEPERRKVLRDNFRLFRSRLEEYGIKTIGESQIVPVVIGSLDKLSRVSNKLKDLGYWVTPVKPPTVPEKTSRLRISLSYNHGVEILERFAVDLAVILDKI